jgi:hypothetical protein
VGQSRFAIASGLLHMGAEPLKSWAICCGRKSLKEFQILGVRRHGASAGNAESQAGFGEALLVSLR